MERPTDDYKKTHNLTVKPRDTTFGGQVSRLQVAELVAAACANPTAAENKVRRVAGRVGGPWGVVVWGVGVWRRERACIGRRWQPGNSR